MTACILQGHPAQVVQSLPKHSLRFLFSKPTVICILVGINNIGISSTFGQILKEPLLVQKQTILQMKAPILNFSEPEGQGRGIIVGMPRLLPAKNLLSGEK